MFINIDRSLLHIIGKKEEKPVSKARNPFLSGEFVAVLKITMTLKLTTALFFFHFK